jgi:hypothetical protein
VTLRDRQEIAIKNGLIELANALTKQLKPDRLQLRIGEGAIVEDPTGSLPNGAAVRVFRAMEGGEGLPDQVLVPFHDGSVELAAGGVVLRSGVELTPSLGAPRSGDVIVLERANGRTPARLRVGLDPALTDKGMVPAGSPVPVLASILTQHTRIPLYIGSLPRLVSDLLSASNAFERDARMKGPETDATVTFTVRINRAEPECDDGLCQSRLKSAGQVALTDLGGAVLAKVAMEGALTTSGYAQGTPESEVALLERFEGTKIIRDLVPKLAEQVNGKVGAK